MWITNWMKMGSSDFTREWPLLTCHKKRSLRLFFQEKESCQANDWRILNLTPSQIRAEYWIVRGRANVKNVLKKCKRCRKMSTQEVSNVAMAEKQVNKITTFQTHWRGLLWTLVCKTEESKEEKSMGLLIHLLCCESPPPRYCILSNSGGVLDEITKIYYKKSSLTMQLNLSTIRLIHNWCYMAESYQRPICAIVHFQSRN